MDTPREKIGLKERYEAGSLVSLNEIGVTDLVQDFILGVKAYKSANGGWRC